MRMLHGQYHPDQVLMNSCEIETTVPPTSFNTHHDDVIHDAKVDFYGRRLATASSDRTIRIFQINENETETLLSILSGHEGPVWQVAWAHPKFGSILASCSYDGSVIIWQEDKQSKTQNLAGTHSTWTKIKIHRVHESSVNSICFAPHAYGLHLACASSDGKVSILSQVGDDWQSQIISAHSTGCNSVSWAPSAVGSSLLSLDFKALDKKPVPLGPKMIVTGGCDNTVKLWKAVIDEDQQEKWQLDSTLNDHTDWVRDVCWRPNLGQAGHMLVSCSQDNSVLIWKFNEKTNEWQSKPLKQQSFPDTLWRVSFSEYGHLLAVSCGDNTVTLWRECPEDATWELVGNVDENVTDTVKIEEPLAVEPPPSAPVPDINFDTSHMTKFVADNGYVKPMSPMVPTPSVHNNQVSPGYKQFNQAYDDYQNAHTPTIPAVEIPAFNSLSLAEPVIPEVPDTSNEYQQYSYDQSGYGYEPAQYSPNELTNTDNLAPAEHVEEFNKDVGFVNSSADYSQNDTYYQQSEQSLSYDQYQYDGNAAEPSYGNNQEQYNYDHDQSNYSEVQAQVDYSQDQQDSSAQVDYSQDQQTYNENQSQVDYNQNQSAYGQYEGYSNYEAQTEVKDSNVAYENQYNEASYSEIAYNEPIYEAQGSYDQATFGESNISYYETPNNDETQYSTYYQAEAVQNEQQQQATDYTLQYEGYSAAPASVEYNEDDATRF